MWVAGGAGGRSSGAFVDAATVAVSTVTGACAGSACAAGDAPGAPGAPGTPGTPGTMVTLGITALAALRSSTPAATTTTPTSATAVRIAGTTHRRPGRNATARASLDVSFASDEPTTGGLSLASGGPLREARIPLVIDSALSCTRSSSTDISSAVCGRFAGSF